MWKSGVLGLTAICSMTTSEILYADVGPSAVATCRTANAGVRLLGRPFGAGLMLLTLVACSTPTPEPYVPVSHTREVLVQTIPRGAYISRSHEYIGVAPIAVEIETDSLGRPKVPVQIKATDTPTGAWRLEVLNPINPVPERMLIDLREFLDNRAPISWR